MIQIATLLSALFVGIAMSAPDCDPSSHFVPFNKPITSSLEDAQLLCIDTRNQTFGALGLQILDIQWASGAQPVPLCTVWVTYDYVPWKQFANQSANFACNQTVGSSFFQGALDTTSMVWAYPKTISFAGVVPQECVLNNIARGCAPRKLMKSQITTMLIGRDALY